MLRRMGLFDSEPLFELEPEPAEAVGFAEMAALPLDDLMAADWAAALAAVEEELRARPAFPGRRRRGAGTRCCRRRRTSSARSGSRWRTSKY